MARPDDSPPPAVATEGQVDLLVRDSFFPPGYRGVMVEVGAASPDFLSLGNSFRQCGWRVISVEPNPVFAAAHRARGHEILEFACGEDDRDDVAFTVADASNMAYSYEGGKITFESFSSLGIRGDYREMFDKFAGQFTTREIRVAMRRLDTLLGAIPGLESVDVLSVDIEGWELECLKGLDLGRFQPKVMIIEDLFGRTALDDYLLPRGYSRWHRVTPNNVYAAAGRLPELKRRGFLPPMVSYTPNLEDVLLRRCFAQVTDGFYVDIGAHHPTNASVTRWLYEQGWSGINLEPGEGIAALRADRPRDTNLELAVSDRVGEATFRVHSGNTGTSTLHAESPSAVTERAGEIRDVTVQVSTLPAILDAHAAGKLIQFLKIDAEGAEDAIIAAADWNRHRPEMLVIESTEPYTNTRVEAAWQKVLAANRYSFACFDGINDYWVREESAYLLPALRVPVNVLDFYKIHDPEIESLRTQVVALSSELSAARGETQVLAGRLQQLEADAAQAPPPPLGLRARLRRALQRE